MTENGKDKSVAKRGGLWWGIPLSIALHVAIAAFFLLHFTLPEPKPPKDEAVKVDIVTPEEAKKAEEKPPEKQPEKPPEQPPQQSAATNPPQPPPNVPMPTLRPVFEFGQKDQGPEVAKDGNAADGKKDGDDTLADKEPDQPPAPQPEPVKDAPKPPEPDKSAGVPDVLTASTSDDTDQAAPAGKPAEQTASVEKPAKATELTKARKLFSETAADGSAALAAMGDIPRDSRISQLCATELREQLRHGSPRYEPTILPAFRLRSGNIMNVPKAAFRTRNQWYDVVFQCEVDDNATKVVNFAFKVGDAVPRGDWAARGFPDN